jgi:predicted RND superfamily exporter protein
MKDQHDIKGRFDRKIISYARWLIRWRWPVVIASVLAALIIATGAQNLWFATDYRVFFGRENPQLNAFEALQDIYTKNDNILFVLEPEEGEVFQPEALAAVEELTAEAWKLPYAIRVEAVTNFQHSRAEGDNLIVEDLVADALNRSPEDLEEARRVALNEPFLYNRLITEGTRVTGVNVTFQLPGKSISEVPEAVAEARTLAEKIRAAYPGTNVYLTGFVMLNNAFSEAGINDMMTLIPLMYLVMVLVMIWLVRSFSGTIATVLVITFSTAIAMGIAGWMRIGLTPPSAQAPTMIMTLAIADSIHILVSLLREMRSGRSKREAIIESLRINMQPVFLTSLTTAIGFLSMNFSEVPPFRHLGNITAVGVAMAFVYSVLFLPALIAILPLRAPKRAEKSSLLFERLGDFVVRRRGLLLGGSAIVVLLLTALISRNQLNDQFVKYFDKSIAFRSDTDYVMQHLSGIYNIEFSVESGESGGISNPEYLARLDEFAAWYRQHRAVVYVGSFSDIQKRLNKNMHGDDESYYRLPANRELAAQYLLLYEMSLPYGLDLNNQINVDKSATRFIVTLENVSSREMRDIAEAGEAWLRENTPAPMHATASSTALMFSHISGRNIRSMLSGSLLALLLISFVLVFALRSFKFGALSLIPNLIPAATAFGLWGLLVGQVNTGLSIVMGMTLGIVVDDSIHFISKYLRARREKGLASEDAVKYAFSSVGMALLTTSVVLAAGFIILSFSAFDLNAGMGKLTAITIVLALTADFFLLPPVLMKFEARKALLFDKPLPESSAQPVPLRVENYTQKSIS